MGLGGWPWSSNDLQRLGHAEHQPITVQVVSHPDVTTGFSVTRDSLGGEFREGDPHDAEQKGGRMLRWLGKTNGSAPESADRGVDGGDPAPILPVWKASGARNASELRVLSRCGSRVLAPSSAHGLSCSPHPPERNSSGALSDKNSTAHAEAASRSHSCHRNKGKGDSPGSCLDAGRRPTRRAPRAFNPVSRSRSTVCTGFPGLSCVTS